MFGISEKIYNFVLTIKNKLMRKQTKYHKILVEFFKFLKELT
jgi:hypothetical protein